MSMKKVHINEPHGSGSETITKNKKDRKWLIGTNQSLVGNNLGEIRRPIFQWKVKLKKKNADSWFWVVEVV